MKAWQVTKLGEPRDVLRLVETAYPQPEPGQLLVRVRGSALNFPDVLMCRGMYQVRPPLPFTAGIELCGAVLATAPDVDDFQVGDRVVGSPATGAFAELATMDASRALPAPSTMDDAQAASCYIGCQTSWFALHRRANLREGETLLVHAAAGGVGSSAVQLGKAAGARVIAVVGGKHKADVARRLGADVVVDRHNEDFVDVVRDVTRGQGADVIYDPVGGETYLRSTKCIAFEGRIVVIGFAGGEIQSAPLNHVLMKNYSVIGLHWGLYPNRNPALVRQCHDELTRLAATGQAVPLVSERVDFDGLPEALQRLADGDTVGRVVLVP